jgi:P2 family phage contractile tail tube protein
MGKVNPIPDKVVNYNIYNDVEKMVGVAPETTLPNFEAMTETIGGAGIAGEFESPNPGHFGSNQMEISYRLINSEQFNLATPSAKVLTLRASQQSYDVSGGLLDHRPLKIIIKGMPKGIDLGKIAVGKPTEGKVTLEVLYIKIEENGETLLEYDKLNFIYVINGVDVFKDIRDQI